MDLKREPRVSRQQQLMITIGLVVVAFGAIVLGSFYQAERLPEDQRATNEGVVETTSGAGASDATGTTVPVNPIEGFLPQSGEGSACREPVGVDLIPGYAATLVINGIEIAPDEMNVKLDEEGNITNEITASRTLWHYTFGPEENCPNGRVIRATDNVLQACVYRLVDGPASCTIAEMTFDAL